MSGANSGGIRFGPGGETARERLITTLKVVMTDEQASDVVDALETYLDEPEDRRVLLHLPDFRVNYQNEVEKLRGERDAAIEFAERALSTMQETLKTLKLPLVEAEEKDR